MASRDDGLENTRDMNNLWDSEGNTKQSRALGPGKSLRHELRTPLNQIIGYAEMLQEDADDEGNQSLAADLKKIEKAGRRLLSLINKLTEKTPALPDTPSSTAPSGAVPFPLPGIVSPPQIRQVAPTKADDARNTKRVLVVDDIETNRDMLARRLQRKGFEADTADGGRAALESLKTGDYDIIILDVMMPDLDGFEVLQIVRQTKAMDELPIIMATARDSSEDIVKALKLGANDYVTKPLDFAVVMARVNTQMSLKRARDHIRNLYRKLEDAQERISSLVSSSGNAMNDVHTWANTVAKQIAPAIGATKVEPWLFEGLTASAMTSDSGSLPPPVQSVRAAATQGTTVQRNQETIVPVVGISGEAFGALVIVGASAPLSPTAFRLVSAFARQLGGALELQQMREEVARSAEQRMLSRQELIDQGVDLLRVCPECGRCYSHDVSVCEKDNTTLPEPLSLPYRIGDRYRLVHELGRGGMGTVYAGQDERLDRPVAVKVVAAEHFTNETIRVRFENEAKAAARVEHEGVVAVFDSGELHNGSLYLVMELLQGCDLGQMIRSHGPGNPHEVASLVRQGGAALAAAHRALLVHRDIKPENIYLVPSMDGFRVKLLDFGVAKQMTVESSLTQTGALIGTPLFMSPEQILGKDTGTPSDLYSFASVIYLALSGRRVTLGESLPEILLDVVQQEPPLISSLVEGIPPEIDKMILSALAKSPDDRPHDLEQWATQLAIFLEKLPAAESHWQTAEGEVKPIPE